MPVRLLCLPRRREPKDEAASPGKLRAAIRSALWTVLVAAMAFCAVVIIGRDLANFGGTVKKESDSLKTVSRSVSAKAFPPTIPEVAAAR